MIKKALNSTFFFFKAKFYVTYKSIRKIQNYSCYLFKDVLT